MIGSNPAATAAINQAVDEIMDKWMVERSRQGTSYHVVNFYRLKDGGMEVRIYEAPEDYPAEVMSATATNGDPMLQIPIPQYEDSEDVRSDLLMDLSMLVVRWLAELKERERGAEAARKQSAKMTPEERSERARRAAEKRWKKS